MKIIYEFNFAPSHRRRERQVCVGVQSEQVVFGGGNIHCITQQEPKA